MRIERILIQKFSKPSESKRKLFCRLASSAKAKAGLSHLAKILYQRRSRLRFRSVDIASTESDFFALQRVPGNPILTPEYNNKWESNAVFNAAAVYLDNKMHFLYRAVGESGLSVFGYAVSADGVTITERSTEPVFVCDDLAPPIEDPAPYNYTSGGSWWGAEDPRLSRVGDTIYLTYTAFDGHNPPCVALSSISVNDFLQKKWNWKPSQIISQPGRTNKNWVVFPEKINGHYALLHSITPELLISYRKSLDFNNQVYIHSCHYSRGREHYWDNWVRGAGPPPLETKDGWLLFYHAMDKNDPDKYKIGAMLLDKTNPKKISYRSRGPILEPAEWYENDGNKKGVVYACGAAIVGDKVYVYYGGSDSFLCAAVAQLDQLLNYLKMAKGKQDLFKPINFRKHVIRA